MSNTRHYSVLRHEVIEYLPVLPESVVLDATLGGGGYAETLVSRLDKQGVFIGFDLDREAITRAKEKTKDAKCSVYLFEANFRHIEHTLSSLNLSSIDYAVLDLGLSMHQLKEGERGFSFQKDEPLLMTMKSELGEYDLTAEALVNEWSEEAIAEALFKNADERFSKRISEAIVRAREEKKITTSFELAEIVFHAVPKRFHPKGKHPATKTFQAIRIAVNDEYGALEEGLHAIIKHLSPGGRVAVVTFHSGEDRIVKSILREAAHSGIGVRITKKPIVPRPEEIEENPASRSAKLRVFEKNT